MVSVAAPAGAMAMVRASVGADAKMDGAVLCDDADASGIGGARAEQGQGEDRSD